MGRKNRHGGGSTRSRARGKARTHNGLKIKDLGVYDPDKPPTVVEEPT